MRKSRFVLFKKNAYLRAFTYICSQITTIRGEKGTFRQMELMNLIEHMDIRIATEG